MRSKSAGPPEHVFPATAFDARFFWDNGVKGEPLFAMADTNYRNGPPARLAYSLGAIVDFPLSLAFDTFLLPMDLTRSRKPAEDKESKPHGSSDRGQPSNSDTDRMPVEPEALKPR